MKKVLLLSILALGSYASFAQSKKPQSTATKTTAEPAKSLTTATTTNSGTENNQSTTTISFDKTTYEFGAVPQGTPVEAEFKFVNTGKEPLVIQKVSAACGCTTPYYTSEPIAPGKSGVIKATYNAAMAGGFNKPVTVNYNGGSIQLNLTGVVEKAPETSAPENKSAILKK